MRNKLCTTLFTVNHQTYPVIHSQCKITETKPGNNSEVVPSVWVFGHVYHLSVSRVAQCTGLYISRHVYSLHLSFPICLMSCSRPCSPSASVQIRTSSSPSRRRSSRSPRVASRASSLHSEICKGSQFHCVPGSQVFHLDGSVRSDYASKIGSAHVMLPDGTSQRYEECVRTASTTCCLRP